MAVNHYFQGGNGIGNDSEKRLHEDLIIEGLKIYGHDCYYLPRTLINRDLILGEDVASRFTQAALIEMYMETTEGFAGQQELISKFGLEIREDTTFTVAKRRWQNAIDDPQTLIVSGRPNVSIRSEYAATCNASLAAKPRSIIRTSGCPKCGK